MHCWVEAYLVCAGIWGGKGQGKTFQCNLAYKKLGIAPVVMSAGELESGNAGEPAKLIRQRYREASDIIKKVGPNACIPNWMVHAATGIPALSVAKTCLPQQTMSF